MGSDVSSLDTKRQLAKYKTTTPPALLRRIYREYKKNSLKIQIHQIQRELASKSKSSELSSRSGTVTHRKRVSYTTTDTGTDDKSMFVNDVLYLCVTPEDNECHSPIQAHTDQSQSQRQSKRQRKSSRYRNPDRTQLRKTRRSRGFPWKCHVLIEGYLRRFLITNTNTRSDSDSDSDSDTESPNPNPHPIPTACHCHSDDSDICTTTTSTSHCCSSYSYSYDYNCHYKAYANMNTSSVGYEYDSYRMEYDREFAEADSACECEAVTSRISDTIFEYFRSAWDHRNSDQAMTVVLRERNCLYRTMECRARWCTAFSHDFAVEGERKVWTVQTRTSFPANRGRGSCTPFGIRSLRAIDAPAPRSRGSSRVTFMIGVLPIEHCVKSTELDTYSCAGVTRNIYHIGCEEFGGYAFSSYSGQICHMNEFTSYADMHDPHCKRFDGCRESGDEIAVILDLKTGALSFEVNGRNYGIAFRNLDIHRKYKLAISMNRRENIKLLNY